MSDNGNNNRSAKFFPIAEPDIGELEVQYVTDAEGHKTAVILSIEEYEGMLEDLHLGRVARESRDAQGSGTQAPSIALDLNRSSVWALS